MRCLGALVSQRKGSLSLCKRVAIEGKDYCERCEPYKDERDLWRAVLVPNWAEIAAKAPPPRRPPSQRPPTYKEPKKPKGTKGTEPEPEPGAEPEPEPEQAQKSLVEEAREYLCGLVGPKVT
jgi:hypothetical protein